MPRFTIPVALAVLGSVLVLFGVDPVKVMASVGVCAIVTALLVIAFAVCSSRKS